MNNTQNSKILIITGSAALFGGVQHWLSYLYPGLKSKGLDVCVGVVEGPNFNKPEPFINEFKYENWTIIKCLTCTPEGRARAVMKALLAQNPDLVLGVNIADTYEGCLRARTKGWHGKVAMTLHGIEADYYDDIKRTKHVLDAVVCTNRLTCKIVEDVAAFEKSKIFYAPYGVLIPDSPNALATISKKKEIVVAYSGRLEQSQKRIHDLLKIFNKLDEKNVSYKLLIAGSGPEEIQLRNAFKTHIQKGKVKFLGKLVPTELGEKLYLQADILIITSLWETGPIVAWEAMAHGCVVVSSEYIGSKAENALIHKRNCMKFPIGDTKKAAEVIEALFDTPELFVRLNSEGLKLVNNRYSRSKSIEAWINVIDKLLDLPPNKALTEKYWRHIPQGRLDKFLGCSLAETVRLILVKKFMSKGPGSEWPHAYSKIPPYSEQFFSEVSQIENQLENEHKCDE